MTDFVPIETPKPLGAVESTQLLESEIHNMERDRAWFSKPKAPGILEELGGRKDQLGPDAANSIEEILKFGGSVVELGAGKLRASKELAAAYPQGHVIAVEPYVDPDTLHDLPKNMRVIAKSVEDLTSTDLVDSSVDAAFSGYVFMYPKDKLRFLKEVWRVLKPEGHALIQFFGSPTSPELPELITKFNIPDLLHLTTVPSGHLLEMNKVPGRKFDFGEYSIVNRQVDGATLTTDYSFK